MGLGFFKPADFYGGLGFRGLECRGLRFTVGTGPCNTGFKLTP